MSGAQSSRRNLSAGWPTLAIMIGASVWGVIWFPLRTPASRSPARCCSCSPSACCWA